MRIDGRLNDELRPCKIALAAMKYAEGSCLIEMGDTRVLCAASVEERVPQWLLGDEQGWVTAEYSMLPRAGKERSPRESARGRQSGRTMEIQRLIGRAVRSIADLQALGERTITLDCDVLQADGGTRTAAVTGAFVAFADAVSGLMAEKVIKRNPIRDTVAAVSVGIVAGETLLDLCYEEDYRASVDMNLVMSGRGGIVEIQGTAEGAPFSRQQMEALLDLAQRGIRELSQRQREVLGDRLQ
ncbi:MAG: ribonuclease PH [Armatimonadota bacterium]